MGIALRNPVCWGMMGPSDRDGEEHLRSEVCQAGEDRFILKMLREGNLNPSYCCQFDTSPSSRCPESGEGSQASRRAHEGQHKGTPASKSSSLGSN